MMKDFIQQATRNQVRMNLQQHGAVRMEQYTNQLVEQDRHIKKQNKLLALRSSTIKTLGALLILSLVLNVLLYFWNIELRDSIVLHNYIEHNGNKMNK